MRPLAILPALALTLFVASRASAADQTLLGGPGETCRARSDCRAGLKCVQSTCVDENEGASCRATSDCGGELACVAHVCTVRHQVSSVEWPRVSRVAEEDHPTEERSGFELKGVHPVFGLTWAAGPTSLGVANDQRFALDGTVQGSALFALRAGVMFGRNELSAEVSPGTYAYYSNTGGGAFQFNVSYAHYLPLHEGRSVSVYWPVRLGAGAFTGNTDGMAFFQGRADLFGVALRFGHLMVDMHVPSFRYGVSNTAYANRFQSGTASVHLFSWEVGTSVSYLF